MFKQVALLVKVYADYVTIMRNETGKKTTDSDRVREALSYAYRPEVRSKLIGWVDTTNPSASNDRFSESWTADTGALVCFLPVTNQFICERS